MKKDKPIPGVDNNYDDCVGVSEMIAKYRRNCAAIDAYFEKKRRRSDLAFKIMLGAAWIIGIIVVVTPAVLKFLQK